MIIYTDETEAIWVFREKLKANHLNFKFNNALYRSDNKHCNEYIFSSFEENEDGNLFIIPNKWKHLKVNMKFNYFYFNGFEISEDYPVEPEWITILRLFL